MATQTFFVVKVRGIRKQNPKTNEVTVHDGWFHKSEPKGNCGSGYPVTEINGGCLYATEKNAEKALVKAGERFGLKGEVDTVTLTF